MSPQAKNKAQNRASAKTILDIITESLDSSKAEEITAIDISGHTALGDYMVIASGRSNRHVAAVADYLIQALKENDIHDIRIEGLENGEWVLIDAHDVIVHIFQPEIREFYNLEKIWEMPTEAELEKPKKRKS